MPADSFPRRNNRRDHLKKIIPLKSQYQCGETWPCWNGLWICHGWKSSIFPTSEVKRTVACSVAGGQYFSWTQKIRSRARGETKSWWWSKTAQQDREDVDAFPQFRLRFFVKVLTFVDICGHLATNLTSVDICRHSTDICWHSTDIRWHRIFLSTILTFIDICWRLMISYFEKESLILWRARQNMLSGDA